MHFAEPHSALVQLVSATVIPRARPGARLDPVPHSPSPLSLNTLALQTHEHTRRGRTAPTRGHDPARPTARLHRRDDSLRGRPGAVGAGGRPARREKLGIERFGSGSFSRPVEPRRGSRLATQERARRGQGADSKPVRPRRCRLPSSLDERQHRVHRRLPRDRRRGTRVRGSTIRPAVPQRHRLAQGQRADTRVGRATRR